MSSPPGPKGHPLHGSWRELRADPLTFLLDGALTYGDFFRFRLGLTRCFVLSDPDSIQTVLRDHEGFADKTLSHRMQDAYPRSVARLEGREHLERRRALAPAFQREAVLARAAGAMRAVRSVLGRLPTDRARATLPLLEEMALRSACVLLMGEAGEQVADRIAAAQPRVEAWLGSTMNDEEAYREAQEALATAIRRAAEHRRVHGGAAHGDLLDSLLKAVDAGQIEEQVMIDEIVMMLVTHVPTAGAVAWALFHLAARPELSGLLVEEIDATGERAEDLEGAPLLSAVALEALRLHPPVWVLAREARKPFQHGAWTVNAGEEVLVSPYVLQRLPSYWRRPEEFLPERFLPASAWDEGRPASVFLPFGLGMRKCIGERTALLQMKLMLAALLGEHHIELPAGYEAVVGSRRLLLPPDGLPLVVEARPQAARGAAASDCGSIARAISSAKRSSARQSVYT